MEKIKFSDVANLYLGCKIKAQGTMIYTLSSFDIKGQAMFNDGYGNEMWLTPGSCKPLLRKLGTITDKEKQECVKWYNDGGYLWDDIDIAAQEFDQNRYFNSRSFIWLLSKHFDLFSLIENGEAVDLTSNQ